MAETKSASPGQRSRGSTKTKKRTSARSKTRPRSSNRTKTRSAGNSKPRSASKPKASPLDKPKAAGEAVEETAKDAGRAVGRAASRAKVPLVAGGAALAGAAGGIALGAHQARRGKGLGAIHTDGIARAARKAGDVGMQIGELALEGRLAREASNGKGHRSPVEVVLEGLTNRRSHG